MERDFEDTWSQLADDLEKRETGYEPNPLIEIQQVVKMVRQAGGMTLIREGEFNRYGHSEKFGDCVVEYESIRATGFDERDDILDAWNQGNLEVVFKRTFERVFFQLLLDKASPEEKMVMMATWESY